MAKKLTQKRQVLLAKSNGICPICGRPFGDGPRIPTLDHIVPLAQGGTDANQNLRLVCKECNESKGHFTPEQQREYESAVVIVRVKENRTPLRRYTVACS